MDIAEAVGSFLLEEGCGVEARDSETTIEVPPGVMEYRFWVRREDATRRSQQLEALCASLLEMGFVIDPWSIKMVPVEASDWKDVYKRYFTVTHIGRYFVIKPSWEPYEPSSQELMIAMDPGMAFGTGLHPSTQLVLKTLERLERAGIRPGKILDIGTGTGILAIGATRLWPAATNLAIDNDETAIQVCRENIEQNGLQKRIQAETRSAFSIEDTYDLICANLTFELLEQLREKLETYLVPRGNIVLSGLLIPQAIAICRLYARALHFEPIYCESCEDWMAVHLRYRGP